MASWSESIRRAMDRVHTTWAGIIKHLLDRTSPNIIFIWWGEVILGLGFASPNITLPDQINMILVSVLSNKCILFCMLNKGKGKQWLVVFLFFFNANEGKLLFLFFLNANEGKLLFLFFLNANEGKLLFLFFLNANEGKLLLIWINLAAEVSLFRNS